MLSLILAPAVLGCSEVEQTKETSFAIAAPFRFAFEVSSIDLCAPGAAEIGPVCPENGEGCWLGFTEAASEDLTEITGFEMFQEEGTFWIEGEGKLIGEDGAFGHLNVYSCEVEMSSVSKFSKIVD